jgi:hypothetical protein
MEFDVPVKPARQIKICLNETYSKVRTDEHLYDTFCIQVVLND